ncbi:reverse transcriptase domain-containing protein [Tanacetum coccineum]|uniref:Reverse transcriptase domain-containing protein n=1 Tax=Tanacetum coccineum TaxID=301880 RepID=A0ABQ5IWR1_9ASTR
MMSPGIPYRITSEQIQSRNSRNKPVVAEIFSSSTPGDEKYAKSKSKLAKSNDQFNDMLSKFVNSNTASTSGSGTLPSNTITNPKVDLKGYLECEPEVTKDTVPPTNNESTKDVQPPVVQVQPHVPNSESVVAPVSALMPNPKTSHSYPRDTLKALIGNKEKLSEMARTPLNEHCLAVILNKLPEKLGDLSKFLIPFVDFDADPRVPLILRRSFLKTGRALIDVYEGELTLRVGKEDVTFNLDQTSRYSSNYDDMTENRIDVIEMACEEYSQEVLSFSDEISSSNPTPYYDPIVSTSSPTLTPFGDSDFLLEEVDAFLALQDDPNDPSPPPNQGNYFPGIQKELKIYKAKTDKSSIDEPPEVKLNDLPPHLKYTFLEGDNKLPVIIAKDLSVKEKAALIKVLKSHKRAIAWKLSDIKGINPEFCTHKILMEEDYKPAVQHQRRVNPKIHNVIKKEVEKLLDVRLIYPISDSPWVGLRKLNEATRKDHFPLPFMDQMLERLAGNEYYCFLDGFSGYFQIPIDPHDQEKTTFTCPYGTFAYRRMPFGLYNAPGTFQRCMMAIFHDMIEKTMEVFMNDFLVFRNSFENCLSHVDKMLQRCEDTNVCLNWEKSHFMVKEGIVLGHKISKKGLRLIKPKSM